MQTSNQEPPVSSKSPIQDLKDIDVLCTSKIMIVSLNLERVCTKDQQLYTNQEKMSNPSQESPVSSKAPNQDLKDIDVLYISKIQVECQNFEHGGIKDHIQIKIKIPNTSQKSLASSKDPNQDSKDMDVLCTFKINIGIQNLEYV